MSREGRSQPIQPGSSHGFADPGPAAVGTTPQLPIVIERERRRELALTPISINGLYAVSLITVTAPPSPVVVELARRRELAPIPIAINGLYAITLPTVAPPAPLIIEQASARWRAIVTASSSETQALIAAAFAATVLPPKPTVALREAARTPVPLPVSEHGFVPAPVTKILTVSTVNGTTTVSTTLVRVRARTAAVNGSTTVTARVVRTRARSAAINGSTTVSATVVRTRARSAAISGSTSVAVNVVRTRARTATSTGSTTVTCTLVTSATKFFTATANGSTTVTADLVQPEAPEHAGGGFIFRKRPRIRTVTLRPGHATVCVTAFAPRLTITAEPGVGVVRTRTLAPAPTLVFGASAQSTETLGQLPRSKRDLINRLVMYDTALGDNGVLARSLAHEQVPMLQLATQAPDKLSRSKRDLIDQLVIYDTV